MAHSNIGKALKDARGKKSFTQGQAAKTIGVDQTTISDWELGRTSPRLEQLPALAQFLEKPLEVLELLHRGDVETRQMGIVFPERLNLVETAQKLDEAVQKVAEADPQDIQAVAASFLSLLNSYYMQGLTQSRRSFDWSLIFGGFCLLFFVVVVIALLFSQRTEATIIGMIGGTLVELFAWTFLVLHQRSTNQLASYRPGIESTSLFLIANSTCEQLDEEAKNQKRGELIQQMMLSAAETRKQSPTSIQQTEPQVPKHDAKR